MPLRRGLTVVATLCAFTVARGGRAGSGQPPVSSSPVFVGAQACASCHQQIHDTWTGGRHSKMIQPATADSVKGDFSKAGVSLRGGLYRLRVANAEYFITESFLTGKEQEHRVEYTLGSRRILHYLTTIDKGRIIVLPPSWDVERREWFHNLDIVRPDESDRTPVQQWNKDCVGCHVSQQDKDYHAATGEYATRWVDFGTSCERCHGPGRAHVDRYTRNARTSPDEPRLIVKPTRLDPATSSMICAQCHSLRNTINLGYTAGANYYDDAGFDRDVGVIHLLSGDFDRAAAALEVALGLEPSRPSARFLFALARLGQRRVDEARRLLAEVPQSDPAYHAAQRRLQQLAR